MRILKRPEFLKMPVGTVYAKYAPCHTEEFSIKGDNCGENDWIMQMLDPIANMENSGGSNDDSDFLYKMEEDSTVSQPLAFNVMGRDGCFDEDQLFVVLEENDLRRFIDRLEQALKGIEPA